MTLVNSCPLIDHHLGNSRKEISSRDPVGLWLPVKSGSAVNRGEESGTALESIASADRAWSCKSKRCEHRLVKKHTVYKRELL